jgi:hypothetical protein
VISSTRKSGLLAAQYWAGHAGRRLLTLTGVSVVSATISSASVCQPNGTGCTKAGTYPENAVINSDLAGVFKVVWTKSVVQPYSSGVPLYWTAYVTYTNFSSSDQYLGCPGDWPDASFVSENMSGGSGDDGTVPAETTTCSENPDQLVTVPPGSSSTSFATFHNVPWPGSAVALTWGDVGTSPAVYPFGSSSPPPPPNPSPLPAPSQCPSPYHQDVNGNWAGWGTCAIRDYTGITGDFQVPTVTGKTGWLAIWDGLGGTSCNDALEQTGISAKIVKGKAVYKAWWEVIYYKLDFHSYCWNKVQAANNPHYFKQTIKPGDWIQVSVTYSSSPAATSGTYWLYLKDVTRGWSENVPVSANGLNGTTSRDSAESIVEDLGGGPLPDFGTAYPGNVRVYPSPNLDYGWTQQGPTEYTLVGGKVSVARISPAGDFTVTWKHQ